MSKKLMRALVALLCFVLPASVYGQSQPEARRFWFGGTAVVGATEVKSTDWYSAERGYGFDLGSRVEMMQRPANADWGCARGVGGRPFFFSVNAAPGVYEVAAEIGGATTDSMNTIKAETRRLMHEAVQVPAGKTRAVKFLVHVRNPVLPDGGKVRLKPRESDPILFLKWDQEAEMTFTELNWDDKLTIEFSEETAALVSLSITPVTNATTVFIIGDSTVADQMMEPWGGWGHYLPRWFKAPVVIANHSEHGETVTSFIGEQRWARVLSEMKEGDYVLMQFGINDQRIPVAQFKEHFVRYVNETREKKAFPVLVTSQNLKRMGEDGKAVATLGQHPEAMREVSREMNVPLIDLHAMSLKFYDALGRDKINLAFVDSTHHSNYGAYELAKCVMQGIIDNKLPIAQHVVSDWMAYDPAQPAAPEKFRIPVDPQMDPARPGGPGAPNGQGPQAGAGARGGAGNRGPAQRRGN